LSCRRCNQHKGIHIDGLDPDTGERAPVFRPRRQAWREHFAWSGDGMQVIALTPCGRATVLALKLNNDDMVMACRLWVSVSRHPPDESYAMLARVSSPALFMLRFSLAIPPPGLSPLSAQESVQVVGAVLQTSAVPEPWAQEILVKAQGNPFFLEEIAQTLVDQGMLRHKGGIALPPALQISTTVQGVLGTRIDRLPADEKSLLQTLAVVGHRCARRLLMEIVTESDAEVSPRLSNL
jgi:hypothetical protein